MPLMTVQSKLRDYAVELASDTGFIAALEGIGQRLNVVDHNLWAHHQDGALSGLDRALTKVFEVGEEHKNLDGVGEIYDTLTGRSAKKNTTIVCYGGGILQDVCGFCASTLYRGISWVFVPTTLLAMCDSCIGSKTSLNYRGFKNLLGTFYPPNAVYLHLPFLLTQREDDYYSGLGEVIKLHVMGGADKTAELMALMPDLARRDLGALQTAVTNSLHIKLSYILEDEFDSGRRNLLNYGHCFGHALETSSRYAIPHGQAVVVGMLMANTVARRRGLLDAAVDEQLAGDLLRPGLRLVPTAEQCSPEAMIAAMGQDKKRTGTGLALVMLTDGQELVRVGDVTPDEVRAAIDEFNRRMSAD